MLPIAENEVHWELKEGEFLILRPDAHHYGFAPCPIETEIIWIHFQTFGSWIECQDMNECLENQSELIESHKQKAYLNHCDVCSIFIPKYTEISEKAMEVLEFFFHLEQEPQSMRNWKRQASFQQFLQFLDRDLAEASDATAIHLAEKIELFIRQNYTRDVSNSLLQKELNYHPNYLAKNMLKIYGVTPMAYLLSYRLEQSKRLLIQTYGPLPASLKRLASIILLTTLPASPRKKAFLPLTFDKNSPVNRHYKVWNRKYLPLPG